MNNQELPVIEKCGVQLYDHHTYPPDYDYPYDVNGVWECNGTYYLEVPGQNIYAVDRKNYDVFDRNNALPQTYLCISDPKTGECISTCFFHNEKYRQAP